MKYFLLVLLLLCVGCTEPVTTKRIDHIERILMHNSGSYTVFSKDPNTSKLREDFVKYCKVDLIADLDKDKECYGTITYQPRNEWAETNYISAEFHIHSAKEINGAGWDHGKFGKGQTAEVE